MRRHGERRCVAKESGEKTNQREDRRERLGLVGKGLEQLSVCAFMGQWKASIERREHERLGITWRGAYKS